MRRVRWSGVVRVLGVVALPACSSLLGVDGTYEGPPGEGGGSPVGTGTTAPVQGSTASSGGDGGGGRDEPAGAGGHPAGSTGSGSTGAGGGGGGTWTELDVCPDDVQVASLVGRDDGQGMPKFSLHAGDGALRVRARVASGRVSMAFDEPAGLLRALVFREEDPPDPTFFELFTNTRWATPFDADPWLGAGLDSMTGVVRLFGVSDSDDAASSTSGYIRLRDAWPSGDGAHFLAVHEDGWRLLSTATRDDGFGLVGVPILCSEGGVVGATLVEHTQDVPEVIAVCNDGEIVVQPPNGGPIDHQLAELRSIAAVRGGDLSTTVVVRARDGVFVLRRTSADGSWDLTQVDQVTAYADVMPDERRNRVSIANAPGGGVIVGWTRGEPGAERLAFARCSPEGACCALEIEEAIGAKSLDPEELHASELAAVSRREPALASSPSGEDLALGYLSVHREQEGFTDVIGVRLVLVD